MDSVALLLVASNAAIVCLLLAVSSGFVRKRFPSLRLPRLKAFLPVSVLAVVLTAVVVASLTQQFPAVTIPPPAGATSGCSSLTNETNPVAPLSGTLRFDCGSGGAAFSTTGGTSTPTFTLPVGYTRLGFVSHSAIDCTGSTQLVSGTAITISAGGYDYCVEYNVVGGTTMPSFTVSWSN